MNVFLVPMQFQHYQVILVFLCCQMTIKIIFPLAVPKVGEMAVMFALIAAGGGADRWR